MYIVYINISIPITCGYIISISMLYVCLDICYIIYTYIFNIPIFYLYI